MEKDTSTTQKTKMSQDVLAIKMQLENIDMSQKLINRIEMQERFVADFELLTFAKILDVDIKWLLGISSIQTSFDL